MKPNYYIAPGGKGSGLTIAEASILNQVCSYYQISLEELRIQNRERDLSFVRHLIMYLLKKNGIKENRISEILCRQRKAVYNGIEAIENYLTTNSLNKRDEILMHLQTLKLSA